MTKLLASPTWTQALNWMVTGEPRDCDPGLLDIEHAYAAAFDEQRPVQRMSLERARAELIDRLESGLALATGQLREAIGVNGGKTEGLPSPIPPSAWPNLRIDDATSFAEIDRLEVSIPNQGYANVRLLRADVERAYEAVQTEEDALIGLLSIAPKQIVGQGSPAGLLALREPDAPSRPSVQNAVESARERAKRHKREAKEYLDARIAASDAVGEELPAADPMWSEMPAPKVTRGEFRTLYELTVPAGLRRGRGRPRP